MKCPVCRHNMKMKRTNSTKDGYRWRCRRHCHRDTSRSIRSGSVFEGSHLELSVWLKLIHNLAQGLRRRHVDLIEDGVCGSSTSITRVYDRLRDLCTTAVQRLQRKKKMRIGGRHAFVVLDESKFRHKRKYNRGRLGRTWRRKRSWVFGMLEVRGERRRPVLKLVKRRSRRHLERIVEKYVKPGSQVISDCWRAYHNLQQRGYIHFQVNHQRFFVHPQTGAHTQHIERAWRTYKETVYRYRGNLSEMSLRQTLRFIEWDYWLGRQHRHGQIGRILHDIKKVYKV
ncbi:uncharacterized protein LOC125795242 [Astyanax mexicanus]|uniref:uncharacterized protein LOC125795242 n=1 Tax=Astyanax mexicanus TaxID=7994 RepID=UPI0020CB592B|nr:uncharacterized protein LOC125795242 [Astyanax mexicanus]